MKRIPGIASVALLICLTGSSTTVLPAGCSSQIQDPIPAIREHYAAINRNVRKYRRVKKDLYGFSAEGGVMVAFFEGKAIKKIGATYYGETGRTVEEYYYWNDKLIFVFHKQLTYDRPLSGKVVRTEESRFYFADDLLIRWIDENQKQVASGSTEYQAKQDEYLTTSKQFVDAARSKNPAVEAP